MAKRSLNESTKETTGGFVDVAGINTNWVLDSYGFGGLKKDGSGTPTLYFNFKNGAITTRLVEWDIDEANVIARNKANANSKLTDAEAVQKEINASNGRLMQILGCFVDRSKINIDADSYADLAKAVVAMLDSSTNKGEKLRMKTIYGKDGFVEFSTRNGRFINLTKDPIGDMRLNDWEKDQIKNNKKESTPSTSEELETSNSDIRKGEF